MIKTAPTTLYEKLVEGIEEELRSAELAGVKIGDLTGAHLAPRVVRITRQHFAVAAHAADRILQERP
jgi:hypothetical protein